MSSQTSPGVAQTRSRPVPAPGLNPNPRSGAAEAQAPDPATAPAASRTPVPAAIGLLTSAAVSGPSQAVVAMPMLCFPQVLFSGAFLPVPAMAAVGQVISYAMSDRWAFQALGHAVGLPRLWSGGGSRLGPPLLASFGHTFSARAWTDWVILFCFTVVFMAATWMVLAARCGGRPARPLGGAA